MTVEERKTCQEELAELLKQKKEIERKIQEVKDLQGVNIRQPYGADGFWMVMVKTRRVGLDDKKYIAGASESNKSVIIGKTKEDVVNAIPELIEKLKSAYALEKNNAS